MKTILAALAAALALVGPAHAQSWPAKPVRVLVNVAPGGVADVTMRVLGARLTETLGQPFLVLRFGLADPDHAGPPHTPRMPSTQTVDIVE